MRARATRPRRCTVTFPAAALRSEMTMDPRTRAGAELLVWQFPCGRQVTLCIACTTTFTDFLQARLQSEPNRTVSSMASRAWSPLMARTPDPPSASAAADGSAATKLPSANSPAVGSPARNRSALAYLRQSPHVHVPNHEIEVSLTLWMSMNDSNSAKTSSESKGQTVPACRDVL